jgi:hypothetical protein
MPRAIVIEGPDGIMLEVIRRKSGAERLRIASGMYSSARRMLISHLRATHAEWSPAEVERETARRLSHGAA